ncbi:MAG: RnfABCDGE type electron transport complex subunit D [Thermoanaerobaculaceae bacterium]|nr:RnfABCDGE type electron transport complex subunit D [Thermoanaerobaculaceae bacterium]MDI9621826.1 RnfABCDGE type electron transport complex subunit D [Acidobacteriota bacterium]NLH34376.1 RnfABCDGE type electron transport complex subunit D [Lentimicrobium sp.]HPW54459.1 RnfABCDGE type electron transport complex subunit D [Thermoanaerobaculaceae bacterium]
MVAHPPDRVGPSAIVHVAPGPHLQDAAFTTRRMMADVLVGLAPVMAAAVAVFGWFAVMQVGICGLACLAAEYLFHTVMRRKPATLGDLSAVVTGAILGLSLPWSAPWYVGVIGSFAAIGFGKVVFGGLGMNLFNPAMVGRAFVMISFSVALGAGAFVLPDAPSVLSQATPLTVGKMTGEVTPLWPLFVGNVNGSLGETSAIACLLGGLWILVRRAGTWDAPLAIVGTVAVLSAGAQLAGIHPSLTVGHHLLGGSLLFGALFIATDPVTSPLTRSGRAVFGILIGLFVMVIRLFSGYPEGVMFAVLLANAMVPLINRWTVPTPLGGPVPGPVQKGGGA